MSVYLPVFPPAAVPAALGQPGVWQRFAALRDRVEREPNALAEVRAVFGPLETELWVEADHLALRPEAREAFVARAWARVEEALARVARSVAAIQE